jgi:hypothetical protein
MTINEAVADFPPKYLMRVNAPGGAGELAHGDLVLISRDEMPAIGDVVCAHRRDGTSLLMEMETGLYEPDWRRMPFTENPASTATPTLVGKLVGGTQRVAIPLEKFLAVHRCEGKHDPVAD